MGIRLVREEEVRERVGALFARRRAELVELLPGARVEHVGSTAVPGSLTKGDLDICVVVAPGEFEPASRVLAERLTIHQPENWSPTLASFTAPPEDGIHVGVQLVPAGSADERHFIGWRERLRADPDLRRRYDDLKRRHRADGMDAYRAAKEALIVEPAAPSDPAVGPRYGGTTMNEIRVTLVGGPTALVEYGPLRVLTDPTFDEPGDYPRPGTTISLHKLVGPAIAAAEIMPVDVVLISHDHHSDNLDESGREVLADVPLVLTTKDGAERLGGGAVGLDPGDGVDLEGGIRIVAVPAHHGPPDDWEKNGPVIGFVLSGPDLPRTYISGDNASPDLVAEIARGHGPFDAVVLFAGGAQVPEAWGPDVNLTLDAALAVEAARHLGDAPIVPIHQEGWAHFSSSPAELEAAFADAALSDRLRPVHPGETVALGG